MFSARSTFFHAAAYFLSLQATGYSFGYGFVNYEKPEDAVKAIDKLNGMQLEHKRIKVAYSRWEPFFL